jgi:cytochrome P450
MPPWRIAPPPTHDLMSVLAYEPFGRNTWRDPFPLYQRLRDEDPVHWSEPGGCFVLSRFDDVFAAARDTEKFSSAQGLTFHNEVEALGLAPTIVMMDPPDHTKFRRAVSRGFTPREVQTLEPAIRAFVAERIEALRAAGSGDFVAGVARPLPCFVVADYLGVSEAERTQFEGWTQSIVQAGAGGHAESTGDAIAGLYGSFTEAIERRRADPGDDMISTLVQADVDGGPLGVEEILGYAFVMIAGGNDTATGLLAGSAELLTRFPDQRRRLLDDPSLVPGAVEEMLRLTSPVQGLCRVLTADVTVHPVGHDPVELARGTRVLLCYGAANRDPREFGPDAEDLDVARPIKRLLTFSSGAHFCLGASVARLQGRVVIEELLAQCPDFAVDADAGTFADGAFTRRYDSLPFVASTA